MKNRIGLLIGLVVLSALSLFFSISYGSTETSSSEGQRLDAHKLESIMRLAQAGGNPGPNDVKAPAFTLKATNGAYYSIGGKREKPLVIHFWASWCEACSIEVPMLKKLYEQYQDQIDFMGINVSTEEKLDNIQKFIEKHGISYPVLLDEHKHAADLYELHALPTVFLIDRNGFVLDTFHMIDPLELQEKIGRLAQN
ncbi:TlpA disulfide reductase family protein [Paenibacillus filicis]|uniref:TlpA disulfide reductase family protein n=1 Tax=Paenibacillus filicis TaxID=669464 RepID=A0ABU9DL49_9BACL